MGMHSSTRVIRELLINSFCLGLYRSRSTLRGEHTRQQTLADSGFDKNRKKTHKEVLGIC
jgi:hypothetical protein